MIASANPALYDIPEDLWRTHVGARGYLTFRPRGFPEMFLTFSDGDADDLAHALKVPRGRAWSLQEMRRLTSRPGLTREAARAIALAKLQTNCPYASQRED